MPRSVKISTEIPPPDSMIESLGIAPARQQELKGILLETYRRLAREGKLSFVGTQLMQDQILEETK